MNPSRTTTSPTVPSANLCRARRLSAVTLAATMLLASGCSLPFADGGDDISADVQVGSSASNIKSSETTREDEATDSQAVRDGDETPTTESGVVGDDSTPSEGDDVLAPLTSIDTRFNGRSMQYLGIDIQLGDFITTNQTLQQYLGSLSPTDDDQVLLVEVAVTNQSSGTVGIPRGVLGLRLPSGEWVPAAEMRAADGDTVSTIRPETQATERVVLEFPAIDIAGANFEISEATTIAESIPLTAAETAPAPSTIELAGQVATTGLESPSLWPSCGYSWTGEVLSARIAVEGVDGRLLERATKGQRWVAVEMRATYDATTVAGSSPCDDYGLNVGELSPRLVIDGVSESPVNDTFSDRIDTGSALTAEFWFQIPVETQLIELTDVGGTVIAAWMLDLPSVPGEG